VDSLRFFAHLILRDLVSSVGALSALAHNPLIHSEPFIAKGSTEYLSDLACRCAKLAQRFKDARNLMESLGDRTYSILLREQAQRQRVGRWLYNSTGDSKSLEIVNSGPVTLRHAAPITIHSNSTIAMALTGPQPVSSQSAENGRDSKRRRSEPVDVESSPVVSGSVLIRSATSESTDSE